jgi:hypothetical protein
MNDVGFPVAKVLEGIDAAAAAGLSPIKINMVVKRGVNEQEILPIARHFKGSGHVLRFIGMDVGHSNGWRMDDVVPSAEVIRMIGREMPLVASDANYAGGGAALEIRRRQQRDQRISSVTQGSAAVHARARYRRQALHLPVRDHRLRPARAARRQQRRRNRQLPGRDLAAARRPLFGDTPENTVASRGRDELHRRLMPPPSLWHAFQRVDRIPDWARAEQQPAVVRVEQARVRPAARGMRRCLRHHHAHRQVRSSARSGRREKAMFRIYRDTRFRKDKTPYKTNFSAAIRDRASAGSSLAITEIDHRGILRAGGALPPRAGDPAAHSLHIAEKPASLSAMLRHPRFRKTYGEMMDEDALAQPPSFSADLKHIDAIKQRHYPDWSR